MVAGMPPRMFATLLETPGNPAPKPGDLVAVEVPLNCTIHSADATRLSRLRLVAAALAKGLGRHDSTRAMPDMMVTLFVELLSLAAGDAAANEAAERQVDVDVDLPSSEQAAELLLRIYPNTEASR